MERQADIGDWVRHLAAEFNADLLHHEIVPTLGKSIPYEAAMHIICWTISASSFSFSGSEAENSTWSSRRRPATPSAEPDTPVTQVHHHFEISNILAGYQVPPTPRRS